MNKYGFGRIIFDTILTVVMFNIGFDIKTWQFWVVYGCAWMMSFMTFWRILTDDEILLCFYSSH